MATLRNPSTDSTVKTTLKNIMNSTTGKYYSVHFTGFHQPPYTENDSHKQLLLSSFSLNVNTLGFHPQSQKSEPPYTA